MLTNTIGSFMIKKVFEVSKIVPKRSKHEVLGKLMEEVGELAKEVNIDQGFVKAEPGKDGILGEAVDTIIVALDLIYVNNPNISEEDIEKVIAAKCKKWKATKG